MKSKVFVFGEAEKGELCTPMPFMCVADMAEILGNPPEDSRGIDCAIKLLMYDQEVVYFRVTEEGFSRDDYMRGVKLLYKKASEMNIATLCMPGVGDPEIIDPLIPICQKNKILLILDERDTYDYLTGLKY